MIANFFSKSKPINTVIIIALLLGYYLTAVFTQNTTVFSADFFIEKVGLFCLYILLLLIVSFIVKKNSLTFDNTYGLLFFVILLGLFPKTLTNNSIVISNILLLLAFRKIYSLHTNSNTKLKLFDAGFWIAIASMVYFWNIIFLVLIYSGIVVYKNRSFKNLLIPIVGFITPWIVYFTYHFYFDTLAVLYTNFNGQLEFSFFAMPFGILLILVLLVLIVLWAVIVVSTQIITENNRIKSTWYLLLNHLFVAMLVILFFSTQNDANFLLLFFPIALILAIFLQKSFSPIFKEVLLYLFFVMTIVGYFL